MCPKYLISLALRVIFSGFKVNPALSSRPKMSCTWMTWSSTDNDYITKSSRKLKTYWSFKSGNNLSITLLSPWEPTLIPTKFIKFKKTKLRSKRSDLPAPDRQGDLKISWSQIQYWKYPSTSKLLESLVSGQYRIRIKNNFLIHLHIVYYHLKASTKEARLA